MPSQTAKDLKTELILQIFKHEEEEEHKEGAQHSFSMAKLKIHIAAREKTCSLLSNLKKDQQEQHFSSRSILDNLRDSNNFEVSQQTT